MNTINNRQNTAGTILSVTTQSSSLSKLMKQIGCAVLLYGSMTMSFADTPSFCTNNPSYLACQPNAEAKHLSHTMHPNEWNPISGSIWNLEQQFYTGNGNVHYDNDQSITIDATPVTGNDVRCNGGKCYYYSGRLEGKLSNKSLGNSKDGLWEAIFSVKGGDHDLRIDNRDHIWPAFWLLSRGTGHAWPYFGEIDAFEWGVPDLVQSQEFVSTLHGNNVDGANLQTTIAQPRVNIQDKHAYGVRWHFASNAAEQSYLQFYFDGQVYATHNLVHGNATDDAVMRGFSDPNSTGFFPIINLAMGGKFPGMINVLSNQKYTMSVDSVKYYDLSQSGPAPTPTPTTCPAPSVEKNATFIVDNGQTRSVTGTLNTNAAKDVVTGLDVFDYQGNNINGKVKVQQVGGAQYQFTQDVDDKKALKYSYTVRAECGSSNVVSTPVPVDVVVVNPATCAVPQITQQKWVYNPTTKEYTTNISWAHDANVDHYVLADYNGVTLRGYEKFTGNTFTENTAGAPYQGKFTYQLKAVCKSGSTADHRIDVTNN